MAFRVTFHGGAGSVTGSNVLVEHDGTKILIDCGIEQGKDFSEERAYAPFPYDVSSIDALIISHAHLDHIGRAPKLVREGFKGKVFMTEPTLSLMELMLRDSEHILSENAKQRKLPPLYTGPDVDALLSLVETVPYRTEVKVKDVSFVLRDSGHILGSASVLLKDKEGDTFAFTSDLGSSPTPLLPDTEFIPDANVVAIESVYGNRTIPEKESRVKIFEEAIKRAVARGGTILIPAFSIERTQLMLYELSNLMEAGKVPSIPVFLDSPLAIKVTDVYRKWSKKYFNNRAQDELLRERDLFSFPFLKTTESREDSERISETPDPKIIIAGAGMSHGGRIGKHEARYLPDPKTTLFIVGYQAPGSPGRVMQDGASKVKINKREVKIRATIETLPGWSGHMDRDGLLKFAEQCTNANTFFVTLGEPSSARFLAQRIHDYLGKNAIVPLEGETWLVSNKKTARV